MSHTEPHQHKLPPQTACVGNTPSDPLGPPPPYTKVANHSSDGRNIKTLCVAIVCVAIVYGIIMLRATELPHCETGTQCKMSQIWMKEHKLTYTTCPSNGIVPIVKTDFDTQYPMAKMTSGGGHFRAINDIIHDLRVLNTVHAIINTIACGQYEQIYICGKYNTLQCACRYLNVVHKKANGNIVLHDDDIIRYIKNNIHIKHDGWIEYNEKVYNKIFRHNPREGHWHC